MISAITENASNYEILRALNNIFAQETSFLEPDAWRNLVSQARFSFASGGTDAFIIAMDQDAAYDGLNLHWFRERYDRFAYVDRIVVAASAHGKGMGKALYKRLFDAARIADLPRIACEVNIDPPNPGSLAFHERLGFDGLGDRLLPNGKTVRYFIKTL